MSGINSRNNSVATLNLTEGGAIDLATGMTDVVTNVKASGFFISISPAGTEGLIMVKTLGNATPRLMPFFKGWNPIIVTEVVVSGSNTATLPYWGK